MCAALIGCVVQDCLLLDLRQFHDLLEASAIAVGNLDAPPARGTISRAMVSLSQP